MCSPIFTRLFQHYFVGPELYFYLHHFHEHFCLKTVKIVKYGALGFFTLLYFKIIIIVLCLGGLPAYMLVYHSMPCD